MSGYRVALSTVFAFAVVTLTISAVAQTGPANTGGGANNPMNQGADPARDQSNADADRIYREQLANRRRSKQPAETKDHALETAAGLATGLQLACDIKDAARVASGPATVKGKTMETRTYEVACGDGTGYLLVSQGDEIPLGYSCFAAEGQREVAVEQGQTFEDICILGANRDIKAMASAVMSHAGTACTVDKLKWLGQSTSSHREYTEVVCHDGRGYVIASLEPGWAGAVRALSCGDAPSYGVRCQMTSAVAAAPAAAAPGADPVPTLDDFKAALVAHGIACTPSDIRVIGKENVRKRHVVEFLCPEQPSGLVAFIPLGTNANKFETMDCATAAKGGVVCKLTTAK
jgi:hypothetical protein